MYFSVNTQVLKEYQEPSLDRELDPSSSMMLDVLEMKAASWTAQLSPDTIVLTMKMLEFDA